MKDHITRKRRMSKKKVMNSKKASDKPYCDNSDDNKMYFGETLYSSNPKSGGLDMITKLLMATEKDLQRQIERQEPHDAFLEKIKRDHRRVMWMTYSIFVFSFVFLVYIAISLIK